MSQEFQYFYEDEVYRFNKKGNLEFGMVLENAEFVSSEEESDGDDEDRVTKGSIRVAWHPKGMEQILSEKKVGLADRSLMPGDVIMKLIHGKNAQRGYCRQVHVFAAIQVIGSKSVIMNINSSDLTPLEDFTTDIAVSLDSWVGMVHTIKGKIHLSFPDNSKCVLSDLDALDLEDIRDSKDKDSEFRRYDFYPGQKLCGPSRVFEKAEWLLKSKEVESSLCKPNRSIRVTVEHVEIVQLGIRWQCRTFSGYSEVDKETPNYIVSGDDLKRVRMLNVFEPCTLQLGDKNYYTIKSTDILIRKEDWHRIITKHLNSTLNPCPLRPRCAKNRKESNKMGVQLNPSQINMPSKSLENNIQNESLSENEYFADFDTDDESDVESINSNASTGSQGYHRSKKGPALATKMLSKRRLKRAIRKPTPERTVIPGDRVVVETLMTNSKADIVWQDGSVELGVPSSVLYPIHHLDEQEFFPGDFVVEQKEIVHPHEYGVIQNVDHVGRTAKVKLFRTYMAGFEPQPLSLQEQEVSVYDLRDHPDFRYRPGSVVIRVANFEKYPHSSAGQVLDNLPSGEVSVWWDDGSRSLYFPQDLYKVGEYDSDEGELWDDTTSEDSWETESEHSVFADESETEGDSSLKTKLVANIEKARVGMSKLEEFFTLNPVLQTSTIMKQLLDCFKECRCMDKLMGTSFFHENNFQGLIKRVRERGRQSTSQRMAEQFNRLFSVSDADLSPMLRGYMPLNKEESNVNICENEKSNFHVNGKECDPIINSNEGESFKTDTITSKKFVSVRLKGTPELLKHKRLSETDILNSSNTNQQGALCYLKDSKSCGDIKSVLDDPSQMCAQLCSLMKAQLLKIYQEVVSRYGGHFDMSVIEASENQNVKTSQCQEVSICAADLVISSVNGSNHNLENASKNIDVKAKVMSPNTNETQTSASLENQVNSFLVLEAAPDSHKFRLTMFQPVDPSNFYRTIRKEMKLLWSSLPAGIWVRGYDDRMLPSNYPHSPPLCHYVSYCSDKLNPNLYEDGKVCISLLGTWSGKGTEVWTSQSSLLQVIVSIQGLILVCEPYFNEAGYERQKGTQQGRENSRMYNEMVILKLIQAMSRLLQSPPEVFKEEILQHFNAKAFKMVNRLERWLELSKSYNYAHPLSPTTPTMFKTFVSKSTDGLPEFPLLPASKGFCLTLRKTLLMFKELLQSTGVQ